MKIGDLVKIIKNDMSLAHPITGTKNNHFFNKVGTIVDIIEQYTKYVNEYSLWYDVMFDSGIYRVREDALESINENR